MYEAGFGAVMYGNGRVDCDGGPLPARVCRLYCVEVAHVFWWLSWYWITSGFCFFWWVKRPKAHPSVWVYLHDHVQIGWPSYSLMPYRPEAMSGWCVAWKDKQEFSLNCSCYPDSVPWCYLLCLLILVLLSPGCGLSRSRAQMQERPWMQGSARIMLLTGDIPLWFEHWG